MTRHLSVAVLAMATLVGCRGMTLGDYLRGAGSPGAPGSGLKGPDNRMVYGSSGPAAIVNYRGGPHESPAMKSCNTCSSDLPDDLFKLIDFPLGRERAQDDSDLANATSAAPGVDTVPLVAPDYCADYKGQAKKVHLDFSPLSAQTAGPTELLDALRNIAWMSCDREHYLPRQKHVQSLLQAWLNTTTMKLADVKPVLRTLASADASAPPPVSNDPAVAALLRCDGGGTKQRPDEGAAARDRMDRLEGMGKLTELDRAVALCGARIGALAALDFKRLDWAKAEAQITERETSPLARTFAVQRLHNLRLSSQEGLAKLDAGAAATAETAYTEWFTKTFEPNKALFALAFSAMEKAMGPDDPKGCSEALKGEVESRIKGRKLKNVKEGEDLWEEPVLGVLLQAKALCDATDKPLLGGNEVFVANHGKRWLGPRRAALLALKQDAPVLEPAHIAYPKSQTSSHYAIKAVAPKGDKLLVTLASDQRAEAILACHDNDHIDRILPDGTIRYKEDCVQTGTAQIKNDYAPLLVPKEVGDLIKPGRWVLFSTAKGNDGIERGAGEAAVEQAAIEAYPVYVFPDTAAVRAGRPLLFFNGVRLP
jgi:hypothetical protein